MLVLGIETSCDETAVAVVEAKKAGKQHQLVALSNVISSQIKIHQQYGGVVPEVAARQHAENIIPVLDEALRTAGFVLHDIDLIAVTSGPGLITSLLVGAETARGLSFLLNKPLVRTNHMRGHVLSAFLKNKKKSSTDFDFQFPALCLTVSGGHTEIVYLKNYLNMKKIGATVDDAAGEAFDKIAKMLGLPYPGGPAIAKLAEDGNPNAYTFPRPMIHSGDFHFSFAGLKTSVLYFLRELQKKHPKLSHKQKKDICASVQNAIVDILVLKTIRAAKKMKVKTVILGGGVSANRELRRQLGDAVEKHLPGVAFHVPDFEFCTDNGAMIAAAGYVEYAEAKEKKKYLKTWRNLKVDPNWEIETRKGF